MAATSLRPTSVLVVEDNYLLLELIVALLAQEGLTAHAASSGEAALTLLRRHGPAVDWLFTDIVLPGLIDGWMVAEAYRALHATRPVVFASTTVHLDPRRARGGIVLQKPFALDDVVGVARMMRGEVGQRCA
ncbi:response regulator receiver protein [Methylobacterium sp. 4-46]|uniref:response regulator n=1 Tax=unclassified Methylobacterium TaxID=2615210 RepID=UPI000165CA86|nr:MULTISPECIES: response regulator [Methylobacterium]ACA14850.1 response regulator receiver protein [Methylobacterium sp. 4-46]WFT80593.1 response regulator [Methylobacterium nodulans]